MSVSWSAWLVAALVAAASAMKEMDTLVHSLQGPDDYPEFYATDNLTSGSVVYSRLDGSMAYHGRGALTCDEYGQRHFIKTASIKVKINGHTLFEAKDDLTNVTDLLSQESGTQDRNPAVIGLAIYEHSTYACMHVELREGIKMPPYGRIEIEGTFGKDDFNGMYFKDFERFYVHSEYSVAGKTGLQSLVVSMGPQLEVGTHYIDWLNDDVPMYLVAEPASKLLVSPPDGDVSDVLTNTTRLYQLELLVPSNGNPDETKYGTPVPPQIKAIGYNFIRVFVPRQLNHLDVDKWTLSYASAGQPFFSVPFLANPGEELEMDGLIPLTAYHVLACAQHPDAKQTCYNLLGTTKEFTGRLKFKAVGNGETFPLDTGNGVEFILPPRRCEECEPFRSVRLVITRLHDSKVLFSKTYFHGGIYNEIGFKSDNGYNAAMYYNTTQDEVYQLYEGFRPGTSDTDGFEDVGDPELQRMSPTSFVVKVPTRLAHNESDVDHTRIIAKDARSLEQLFEGTFQGKQNHFVVEHVPHAGPWRIDVTVVAEDRRERGYTYVLNTAMETQSAREVGFPKCKLLGSGAIEVETPKRMEEEGPEVDKIHVSVDDIYGSTTFGEREVTGAGVALVRGVPRDKPVLVHTEVTDRSSRISTFETVLLRSEDAVPLVPEVGTPTVVSRTNDTIVVSVPPRTRDSEKVSIIDRVQVTVLSSLNAAPVAEVFQEGAGNVVVDGKFQGYPTEVVITLYKGDDKEVFRSVARATGLPAYQYGSQIQAWFQVVATRPPTRRVVVRLPKGVEPYSQDAVDANPFAQIELLDHKGRTLQARSVSPGPDIVFDSLATTINVSVAVTYGGQTYNFWAPRSGDEVDPATNPDTPLRVLQSHAAREMFVPTRQNSGGVYVLPTRDGAIVRVTRFLTESTSSAITGATLTITQSSKGREGLCKGKTIGEDEYDLKAQTDTFFAFPPGVEMDLCVEITTPRDTKHYSYHMQPVWAGGVPPMVGTSRARAFPVSAEEILLRIPVQKRMQATPASSSKMVDVSDCTARFFTPQREKILEMRVRPGDHRVSGLPVTGSYIVELLSTGGTLGDNSTFTVLNGDAVMLPVPPPLSKVGYPSCYYDHTFSSLVISVPARLSAAGARTQDATYTVSITGSTAVLATGKVNAEEQKRVSLPKLPASPDIQTLDVTFKIKDVQGGTHSNKVTVRRVAPTGFPPMPHAGLPHLITTVRHRLVLRVPPKLAEMMPPIKRSNSTIALCDSPRDELWFGLTQGGGDIEIPQDIVDPNACYRIAAAVTNYDDSLFPIRFEFEMATADLPPRENQGEVQLTPVGDGYLVVRVPTLRTDEDMAIWLGQRVFVRVFDVQNNELLKKEVARGTDTVLATPCWSQNCRVVVNRTTARGNSTDLDTTVVSALLAEYEHPDDPAFWTTSSHSMMLKNPVARRVDLHMEERDTEKEIISTVYAQQGYLPIEHLTPATTYIVTLKWRRGEEYMNRKMYVKTPRVNVGGPDMQTDAFNLVALGSAGRLVVQVPEKSNGAQIERMEIEVYEVHNLNISEVEELSEEDTEEAAERSGIPLNATERLSNETVALVERDLPSPGEHVVIDGLLESAKYALNVTFFNQNGLREQRWLRSATTEIPFTVESTHMIFEKDLSDEGLNTLVVQPREQLPTNIHRMMVAHEKVDEWQPVTDYTGGRNLDRITVGPMNTTSRYRVGWTVQLPDMTYEDTCAFVTTDARQGVERGAKNPMVLRVTVNQIYILLPKQVGLDYYTVAQLEIDPATGWEVTRHVMYKGLGEDSKRGKVFVARALPADTNFTFAIQPFFKDGRSGNPVMLDARTDSVFKPCIVGRPTQPGPPMLVPETLVQYGRQFLIMWHEVDLNQGSHKTAYPTLAYDVESQILGYQKEHEKTAKFKVVRKNMTADDNHFFYKQLTPGFWYRMRIVAWNYWGESPKGFTTDLLIPSEQPEAPARPVALNRTPRSVFLQWKQPYHNGELIDDYKLECSPGPDSAVTVYPSHHRASGEWHVYREGGIFLDHHLGALIPARNYSCRVYAHNKLGWSLPSESVVFWTMTDVPERVTDPRAVSIGRYFMNVQFGKPRHNGLAILGYDVEIKRPGEGWAVYESCDDILVKECPIGTLLPGDTYSYRINAENCAGKSQWSPVITVTTLPAPPDPTTALMLVEAQPRQLELDWNTGRHNGRPITRHSVECDAGYTCYSGDWERPAMPPCFHVKEEGRLALGQDPDKEENAHLFREVWAKTTAQGGSSEATFTVRPATTYRCRAYAWNSEGHSNITDHVLFRSDDTVPDAPPNFRVTESLYSSELSEVTVTFEWNDATPNGQYVQSYTVYRKNFTRSVTGTGMTLAEPVYAPGQWTQVFESMSLMYNAEHLRPDTVFHYKVVGKNSLGMGIEAVMEHRTEPGKPEQPLSVVLDSKGATWLEVTCPPTDDAGSMITKYIIEKAEGAVSQHQLDDDDGSQFGEFVVAHEWNHPEAGDGHTHIRLEGLEQGTDYKLRCQYHNAVGKSQWSDAVVYATHAAPPDTPLAPTAHGEDYHTHESLKMQFLIPDDNGQRIDTCTVVVGGSWEWAEDGFPREAFANDAARTPLETVEAELTITQPYEPFIVFDTSTDLMATRPCEVCHEETGGTIPFNKLLAGHEYSFQVKCHNELGHSSLSNRLYLHTDGLPPRAPEAPATTPAQLSVAVQLDHPFEYGEVIERHRTTMACEHGSCDPEKCSYFDEMSRECVGPIDWEVPACTMSCANQAVDCESCEITGLLPGTRYKIWSRAYNMHGWSDKGHEGTFTTLPAAPLIVREVMAMTTPTTVTVKWQAPAYNQGNSIKRYHIQVLCDPEYDPQADCVDVVGDQTNMLSDISPTAREHEVEGVKSGLHYLVYVNAENDEGKSPDAVLPVWIAGSPPAGLQRPMYLSASADELKVVISAPTNLHGADLSQYQVAMAELGTDLWITDTFAPSNPPIVRTFKYLDETKLYILRMRAKVSGKSCDLPGATCFDWSDWSVMSNAMGIQSNCPVYNGLDCSGHGACDGSSGRCYCAGNWMGDDCSVPVNAGQTCSIEDLGKVVLWDGESPSTIPSYTFTTPEIGEYSMYSSTDRPHEHISVNQTWLDPSLGPPLSVGLVGAAIKYEGHTLAVSVDPDNKSKCPVVTHNCDHVMSEVSTDYVAFTRDGGGGGSFKVSRSCDNPSADIVIYNEITGTRLVCQRWPNEGYLESCTLHTRRRRCEGVPGFKKITDKTAGEGSSRFHVETSTRSTEEECGSRCNDYGGTCQMFLFIHDTTSSNCKIYRLGAYMYEENRTFTDMYVRESASLDALCDMGDINWGTNLARGIQPQSSSIYSSNWNSARVTDGTSYSPGFHSIAYHYWATPWVQVELAKPSCVRRIRVYARTDCCVDQFMGLTVRVHSYGEWFNCPGSAPNVGVGGHWEVTCEFSGVTHVRVEKYLHPYTYLSFTELEVFGESEHCHISLPGNPSYLETVEERCEDNAAKLDVLCCSMGGSVVSTSNYGCHSGKTYDEAKTICSQYGYELCSRSILYSCSGCHDTNCGFDSKRVWTSSTELIPGEVTAPTCAYENEDGLCGLSGYANTPASAASDTPLTATIEPVSASNSLFNDLSGQTCRNHEGEEESLLMQTYTNSSMTPAAPDMVDTTDLVEPTIVMDLQLAETTFTSVPQQPQAASHVTLAPQQSSVRPGVIDKSLRPHGHQPLGLNLLKHHAATAAAATQAGRLAVTPTATTATTTINPSTTTTTTTTPHHTPAVSTVQIPAPETATAPQSNDVVPPHSDDGHGVIAKGLHDREHSVQHAGHVVHAKTPLPTRRSTHYQFLAQSSATPTTDPLDVGGSATEGKYQIECDESCDPETCELAQSECQSIALCKAACVQNVCNGQDPDRAVDKAQRCDERTKTAMEQAKAEQKGLEADAESFVANVEEDPLSACPLFVSGNEEWNLAPYDETVPAWTVDKVQEVRALLDGKFVDSVNNQTTTNNPPLPRNSTAAAARRHSRRHSM